MNYLNLIHTEYIESMDEYMKVATFSSRDFEEYLKIKNLISIIEQDSNRSYLQTQQRFCRMLCIINCDDNQIILNITHLKENYRINLVNNILIIRYNKSSDINEIVTHFGNIINNDKNYTFLKNGSLKFRIHNINELFEADNYLNKYYMSDKDYQLLIDFENIKHNPKKIQDYLLD